MRGAFSHQFSDATGRIPYRGILIPVLEARLRWHTVHYRDGGDHRAV